MEIATISPCHGLIAKVCQTPAGILDAHLVHTAA